MSFKKSVPFEERTEKELLIAQTKLLEITALNSKSTNTNITILTWITIIGVIISIIGALSIV